MVINPKYQRSSFILLNKRIHRGKIGVFLDFKNRKDWLIIIKALPDIKFSRTIGSWYLPYTKKAYNNFLKLKIEFKIVDSTGTTEDIASKGENTGIDTTVSQAVISADDIDLRTDKHETIHGPKITYNSNKFIVELPYDKNEILFLKTLDKSWWDNNSKIWIMNASINNLVQLQKRYTFWDKDKLDFIGDMIKKIEDPCQVELYLIPSMKDRFCIKIKGYKLDVAYLKSITHREYNNNSKIWTIPFDQKIIKRLIAHYESKGTKVINRIPYRDEKYTKVKTPYLEVQQRLLNKLTGDQKEVMGLYIRTMTAQRYSTSTIKQYSTAFLKYIQYYKNIAIGLHTEIEVNRYLADLTKGNLSFSTVNMVYSAVKFYFEKIVFQENFIFERLKRPRKGRTLPTIMSIREVDRLLRSCDNLKHITILYTLYSSGIRLSEILNIKVSDILWDRNQIFIKSGKGNKDRMVMLSEALKKILQSYFDEYTPTYWMFEGQDRKTQYSSSSIQKIVKKASIKAGIMRKVTPHTLRHCFATHLLDNGTDIRYIQELLGHKDIKTTLLYTHVTTRQLNNIQSPLDKMLLDRNFNTKSGS